MDVNNAIEDIDPSIVSAMTSWARDNTWRAIQVIKSLIRPGMSELEAIELANNYLTSQGVVKYWHKTYIRFGVATVLGFRDTPPGETVLQENDIFYIDIGPVWDGVEGDCGNTFMVGNNPEHRKIIADLPIIFKQARDHWLSNKISGIELQSFTEKIVKQMGYLLHPAYVKGHRLSEFSHFDYTRLGLFDLDFKPASERWVLEFQICHPSMKFGAFYEDLLI